MKRSLAPRLTGHRRRALAVPFVITLAAAGTACGSQTATVPVDSGSGQQGDVVSNPAEPEPEGEVTISNPAEPEPEGDVTISNPAEPEPEPTDDSAIVISNPAPPFDG